MIRLLMTALLGLGVLCAPTLAQKKDEPRKTEPAKGQLVKVKSVDDKTNTLIVITAGAVAGGPQT